MRRNSRAWAAEFDKRLKDPDVKKDLMDNAGIVRPREVRVADDEGTMRRRNGNGCCGCGKWTNHHSQDTMYSHDPVVKHSHDKSEKTIFGRRKK